MIDAAESEAALDARFGITDLQPATGSSASKLSSCAGAVGFDEAMVRLRSLASPLGTETVPIQRAGRRVLAAPVVAALDSPRWDVAAMDGYAVADRYLDGSAARFTLTGEASPGAPPGRALCDFEAMRIFTGARLPDGADRVVMQELAEQRGAFVDIPPQVSPKRHVRLRGSDFQAGDILVPAGRIVDAWTMVASAAADAAELTVFRRPRVAIIASGDELAAPGMARASLECVPEALTEALVLLARQAGAKPGNVSIVSDRLDRILAQAEHDIERCDVLVFVGGASVGKHDLSKAALRRRGLEFCFPSVKMKPGKPVWHGCVGATHVLGLPGNPTAAMTAARLFLTPLLHGLGGRGFDDASKWSLVPTAESISEGADRDLFLCASLGAESVRVLDRQEASSQIMLVNANALVRRRPGALPARAGELVEVMRL